MDEHPLTLADLMPRLANRLATQSQTICESPTATSKPLHENSGNPKALPLLAAPRQRVWTHKPRRESEIPASVRSAIMACVRGQSPWPLVLHGPSGTGKSSAALCLLDRVGHGEFHRARDCVQLEFSNDWNAIAAFHRAWKSCDCAVLDQFGMDWSRDKPTNPAIVEVYVGLFDWREGRPLVITTNHDLRTLGEMASTQMFGRLAAGTVVEVAGVNRRLAS